MVERFKDFIEKNLSVKADDYEATKVDYTSRWKTITLKHKRSGWLIQATEIMSVDRKTGQIKGGSFHVWHMNIGRIDT